MFNGRPVPFHGYNSVWSQLQNVHPSISYESKVGRPSDGQSVIEERGVLNRTAVIALGAKMQHGSGV